ncbi:MAG TPA: polymer-forming cytoskeletal protein [Ktedonobacterales bacterium]
MWTAGEPGAGASAYAPDCTPGNRVAYGHALVIPASDWICGDADAYGGGVRVLGRVSGNVVALGGAVTIGGEVDGNVSAFGGSVALLSTARVAGDVQVWGGHVTHAPGATVAGNIESGDRMREFAGGVWPSFDPSWHFPAFWLLGWAALAALVATLLPERTARVRQVARGALGRSLLVGMLTAILGAGLAALLFATCIGIPFSLLLVVALFAAWVLGTVAVSLWVGERLLGIITSTRPSPVLAAIVGAVALSVVESVPCVGGALMVVASSVGLGAALLSRFGGHAPMPSFSAAAPPAPR